MKTKAQVVIVGGGVIGLTTAYNLARMGISDIVVLEANYIMYGASGRNEGRVWTHWEDRDMVMVARESVKAFRQMTAKLNINVWYRRGGCMTLTRSQDELARMEKNVRLQNSLGVKSRMIDRDDAMSLAPALDRSQFIGGSYCKDDGMLYPYTVIWGHYDKAKKMGVEIHDFTPVEKIIVQKGKVKGVSTPKGSIDCDVVVNAAGAYSCKVSELAGLKAPNFPVKREVMVTEPLKPFLDPMVVCVESGLSFAQTMRGEVIGGIPTKEESTFEISSSLEFLKKAAGELVRMVPRLRSAKVLRQWAGLFDMTPDEKPIVGRVDGLEGFYLACGLCDRGFMMSPVVSRIVAEEIAGKKPFMTFEKWRYDRFQK